MAMLFGRAPSTSAAKTTPSELSRDVELANGPGDSISDLCWSPVSSHLAVASWDQKVRIYEVNSVGSGEGRAFIDFDGAVLNCHWSKVGCADRRWKSVLTDQCRTDRESLGPGQTKQLEFSISA